MLPEIDAADIAEELNIKNRAIDAGDLDLPRSSDKELDGNEKAIADHVARLNSQGRTIAEATVADFHKKFSEIDLTEKLRTIEELPDYTRIQVDHQLRTHRETLVNLRVRERRMLRALKSFEARNDLKEPAEYPESRILHWAIVIAMVVIESFANSYFFAKGSDFGLIGGASQALTISVVNIGIALLAGNYLLRYINHIDTAKCYAAWAGLLLYGLFVVVFNLAAAHYRALLEIDPTIAIRQTLQSVADGPFSFNNFDAAILLFIGILFSLAALIKGYASDSAYPHHGLIDRRHKTAEEEYIEAKDSARQDAYDTLGKCSNIAQQEAKDARANAHNQPAILAQIDQFVEEYRHYNAALQEAYVTLLKNYRETNKKVRTSQAPKYFDTFPSLGTNSELPLERLSQERAEAFKTSDLLKKIDVEVKTFSKSLRALTEEVNVDIEKFIKELEAEADERAARDMETT